MTNYFKFALEISLTMHYKYTCHHAVLYPSNSFRVQAP